MEIEIFFLGTKNTKYIYNLSIIITYIYIFLNASYYLNPEVFLPKIKSQHSIESN